MISIQSVPANTPIKSVIMQNTTIVIATAIQEAALPTIKLIPLKNNEI